VKDQNHTQLHPLYLGIKFHSVFRTSYQYILKNQACTLWY